MRVDVNANPPRLTKGLKLHVVYALHGKNQKTIKDLYKQVWEGR